MMNVLVVDDSIETRHLLAEMMSEVASCDTAETGEQALAAYERSIKTNQTYDLILLDVVLKGMSGLDILKAIRKKEQERGISENARTPVIIVSAYQEHQSIAAQAGCNDYLLKPVDSSKLLDKARSYFGLI